MLGVRKIKKTQNILSHLIKNTLVLGWQLNFILASHFAVKFGVVDPR
jgi:hypothetical protein